MPKNYEVEYYAKDIDGTPYQVMEVIAVNRSGQKVHFIECADPSDYRCWVEDDKGIPCENKLTKLMEERLMYQDLHDRILKQAEAGDVDFNILSFPIVLD